MVIQEDDVLEVVASYLESANFLILVHGGNQSGLLNYNIGNKFRKSPDIVAFRNPYVLIFEGKVRAGELFKTRYGISDYEAIKYIIEFDETKNEILKKVRLILLNLGLDYGQTVSVYSGLIASTSFDKYISIIDDKCLVLRVDMKNKVVHKIIDKDNILIY